MNDIPTLIDLITRGGLLSALIVALIGGKQGWYVWGGQHRDILQAERTNHTEAIQEKNTQIDDLRKDRDYWRDQAMKSLSISGRAVGVVEATRKQE